MQGHLFTERENNGRVRFYIDLTKRRFILKKLAMDNQGLDFDDALDYAVEKEKDLIFTARENARREAMLEGKTWATMELI